MHVKQFCNDGTAKEVGGFTQQTTSIDLESIDDKSKVSLFVRHHPKIDLKTTLKRGHILLVREAHRKISNKLDIYVQLIFNSNNFKVIG